MRVLGNAVIVWCKQGREPAASFSTSFGLRLAGDLSSLGWYELQANRASKCRAEVLGTQNKSSMVGGQFSGRCLSMNETIQCLDAYSTLASTHQHFPYVRALALAATDTCNDGYPKV
jgi:hypothetical protein